jgi:hypothetical protein
MLRQNHDQQPLLQRKQHIGKLIEPQILLPRRLLALTHRALTAIQKIAIRLLSIGESKLMNGGELRRL